VAGPVVRGRLESSISTVERPTDERATPVLRGQATVAAAVYSCYRAARTVSFLVADATATDAADTTLIYRLLGWSPSRHRHLSDVVAAAGRYRSAPVPSPFHEHSSSRNRYSDTKTVPLVFALGLNSTAGKTWGLPYIHTGDRSRDARRATTFTAFNTVHYCS